MLQVAWDEPDLLQNVKCVSPWLVELVSNMPVIHLSPFSPPRKKFRLPLHPDFPLDGQFPIPSFSGNPLGPTTGPFRCLPDNVPAGIQGARHTHFGVPFSDLHHTNKLHPGLVPPSFRCIDQCTKMPNSGFICGPTNGNEDISCLLTMGNSSHKLEKTDNVKAPRFILFGQPILTEQQISSGSSSENLEKAEVPAVDWQGFRPAELGLDTGHCKVFLQSEDVGRSLDLSALRSYEELYRRLANMFGIERSKLLTRVLYRDASGSVKQTGDEPFRYDYKIMLDSLKMYTK